MSWDEDIRPPVKDREIAFAAHSSRESLFARIVLLAVVVMVIIGVFVSSARAAPSWDWQLNAPYEFGRDLDVFVGVPGRDTRRGVVTMSMLNDTKVVCQVSVGTVDSTDSFARFYPAEVVGKAVEGRADAHYLDIRKPNAILMLLAKRFNTCAAEQYSAIAAADLDVHLKDTGFDISAEDVVAYGQALAKLAGELDLEIVQVNVPELTPQLVDSFDFAITEGCYQGGWCESMQPYLDAGKMVLDAEYSDQPINWAEACEYAENSGISMILKDRDLTADLQTCP